MEEKAIHPLPEVNQPRVVRYLRDAPPAHYTMKIKGFSLLVDAEIEKYESRPFCAGGYKWKLNLYPNGNKKQSGKDNISLYPAIAEPEALPLGWEAKTESGFDKAIALRTFNVPSNGFLADDSCIFGVEVFVVKSSGNGECITMIKNPGYTIFTWKISGFSAIDKNLLQSEEFHYWQTCLIVYPKGDSRVKGRYISLFLELADSKSLPHGQRLFAESLLTIKDQISDNHRRTKGKQWFSAANKSWGISNFMLPNDLKSKSIGYLRNDTIIVEAQITLMSVVKNFS